MKDDVRNLVLAFLNDDAAGLSEEELAAWGLLYYTDDGDTIVSALGLAESNLQVEYRMAALEQHAIQGAEVPPTALEDPLPRIYTDWDMFRKQHLGKPTFRSAMLIELCRIRNEVRARKIAWQEAEARAQREATDKMKARVAERDDMRRRERKAWRASEVRYAWGVIFASICVGIVGAWIAWAGFYWDSVRDARAYEGMSLYDWFTVKTSEMFTAIIGTYSGAWENLQIWGVLLMIPALIGIIVGVFKRIDVPPRA